MFVLSLGLLGKFFKFTESFENYGVDQFLTVKLLTKSLIVLAISYYILIKVFT